MVTPLDTSKLRKLTAAKQKGRLQSLPPSNIKLEKEVGLPGAAMGNKTVKRSMPKQTSGGAPAAKKQKKQKKQASKAAKSYDAEMRRQQGGGRRKKKKR
jgi:hypothetical protein